LRLVAVIGTKKSGKTTVVERMLAELRSRGLRVGTLKLIHHEGFTIHSEGRDTARHWEAGADFSVALAPGETTLVRRTGGQHEGLADIEGILPTGTDVLLAEGLVTGGPDVRTVVCSRTPDETRVLIASLPPDSNPVAASGLVGASEEAVEGLLALDVTDGQDLRRLADLALG